MQIEIPDDDIKGFNHESQAKLQETTKEFVSDMIAEANRIESGSNSTSDGPQITSSMVDSAYVLIRRGLSKPKRRFGLTLLRILSAILPLAVGVMYNTTKLQSGSYMLLFVLVVTATILCVTISTIKE
jgi:hypothetical protein